MDATTAPQPSLPAQSVRWSLPTRVAFRVGVLYFTLYVVCTQMIGDLILLPNWGAPSLGIRPPMSSLVMWVIRHVFHDSRNLAMVGGSGDKLFD